MSKYIPGDPFAYRGKHRKSRGRQAVKVAALAAPMTLAGLMLVGVTPLAANATVKPAPSWTQRTCSAFARWESHQTAGNLNRMMTDSEHAAWRYLGDDVATLYVNVRGRGDVDLAVQYVYEDCNNGSGL